MVVANTMHASSPANAVMSRFPTDTVRESAPAQASVAAILTAMSRSGRVGPEMTFSAAQNARIKRQTAAKSQMSGVTRNHTPKIPGYPGFLLSRITVVKWRTGTYQTSRNARSDPVVTPTGQYGNGA